VPNIVYIATSVDGFIATKDGGLDWLNEKPDPSDDAPRNENTDTPESQNSFSNFMKRIDALVMGRIT